MSSAPELKPCPFCGGESLSQVSIRPDADFTLIHCEECGGGNSIKSWNSRTGHSDALIAAAYQAAAGTARAYPKPHGSRIAGVISEHVPTDAREAYDAAIAEAFQQGRDSVKVNPPVWVDRYMDGMRFEAWGVDYPITRTADGEYRFFGVASNCEPDEFDDLEDGVLSRGLFGTLELAQEAAFPEYERRIREVIDAGPAK